MGHTEETKKRIAESRLQAAHRIADAYAELGLPETKKCNHPEHAGENPLPIEQFTLKTRIWSDGRRVKYPASYCRTCAAAEHRARRQRKDPEERKKQESVWRKRHIAKDPEGHREYQRIWHEGKRRREGLPQRNFSVRAPDLEKKIPLENTEEFKSWLRDHNVKDLERILGMSDGSLGRIATGQQHTVTLDVADRIIVAAGNCKKLDDFWPDR